MNNPKIAFSRTHPSEMRGRPDVLIVDNSSVFERVQEAADRAGKFRGAMVLDGVTVESEFRAERKGTFVIPRAPPRCASSSKVPGSSAWRPTDSCARTRSAALVGARE
jgi:hypothetical protein